MPNIIVDNCEQCGQQNVDLVACCILIDVYNLTLKCLKIIAF